VRATDMLLPYQGSCTWPNGDTYEGEWRDNRMHGRGVFVWKHKSCRYEGEVWYS
jgi:hypothetical protein